MPLTCCSPGTAAVPAAPSRRPAGPACRWPASTGRVTQAREAAVAPLVRDISPALIWHFDDAGWNVLGYQYAPGRHADPANVNLFAAANARLWDETAQSSTSDWTAKMAQAGKSWTAYRQAH